MHIGDKKEKRKKQKTLNEAMDFSLNWEDLSTVTEVFFHANMLSDSFRNLCSRETFELFSFVLAGMENFLSFLAFNVKSFSIQIVCK
jgi:hypothetical protein